ncbi:MAG: AI-2E family transporter [[Clostridium] scindens]
MVLHLTTKSNEIFGGFIIGKIIDSAIIGVLCFFGPHHTGICLGAVLVSVIVGVTNVIPFFGPYIGAIPSAILIMLADPIKGLYFIIFILCCCSLTATSWGRRSWVIRQACQHSG